MADIDIDRQLLVSAGKHQPSMALRALWFLAFAGAALIFALVGFKLAANLPLFGPSVQTSGNLDQVQQQLDDIQRRLDILEKHRRVVVAAPATAPAKRAVANSVETGHPPSAAFTISSASSMKPEADPDPHAAATPSATPAVPPAANAPNEASVADHEAWEATADRLADVVGVVGSQQGEITQTRDQVNQLLAQTRRTALQFELRRGTDAQPVGPVSLLLRDSDQKKQRYSVCVYVSSQCIELKDRAVGEVVAFSVSHDRTPLELIATKVTGDAIAGYLEIPKDKQAP
jgi:hypothetical protein